MFVLDKKILTNMSGSGTMAQSPAPHEHPMYLQRPSSAKSQDVQHILAKTFRNFFTRDAIPPDTVNFLKTSKGGDDAYHEKYVESLQKVVNVTVISNFNDIALVLFVCFSFFRFKRSVIGACQKRPCWNVT